MLKVTYDLGDADMGKSRARKLRQIYIAAHNVFLDGWAKVQIGLVQAAPNLQGIGACEGIGEL